MNSSRFRREAPLLMAALFIAFVIWLIAVQRGRDTSWVTIQITPSVPSNMEVTMEPPEVSLNIQYPREQRSRIVPDNFEATIDIEKVFGASLSQWPPPSYNRKTEFNLSPDNVRAAETLPPEVHIIQIEPNSITINASLRIKRIPVEVVTTGTLDSQLQLAGSPVPQPQEIFVTGSQDALNRIANEGNRLRTQPVDLATLNRTQSQQLFRELAVPPDLMLVHEADRNIAVNLRIEERVTTRTILAPVVLTVISPELQVNVTPTTASVRLEGPPSALNQIQPDSFSWSTSSRVEERVGPPQTVGVQASLRTRVPAEVSSRVRILEVNPPRISVEFVPAPNQNEEAPAPGEP